jgi:hypothetical protein
MQGASDSKRRGSSWAAPPEAVSQGEPHVVNDLCDPAAQLPPCRRVRQDGRSDRDLDPAERSQPIRASNRDRTDRNSRVQREMPDPDLERPEGPPARVAAFRKDQDDTLSLEDLIDGSQPGLVELAALRRNRKYADQWQQPALPARVEDCLALGHRVNHRRFREERDYEPGVEPGLVIGGDDVRRGGYVLEADECDPEQLRDEPPEDAAYEPIEP